GLDPRARIELREMIAKLAAAGKAVLISSHILTELAEICDKVAIIEQGQLLAQGSMDEISSQAEEHFRVTVRVLDAAEPLAMWLASRENVSEVHAVEEVVHFTCEGDQERQADLLRELVNAGFRVRE